MSIPNSENPNRGKKFEEIVGQLLERHFKISFLYQQPILLGNPPKPHKFDWVSCDGGIVVECKYYSYTESGNNPSAKIMGLNEAAFLC